MARKKKYDYCDDAFKATGDGRYNICYGRPREIVMMKIVRAFCSILSISSDDYSNMR